MVGTLTLLLDNLVDTLNDVIARVRAGQQIVPEPSLAVKEWPLIGESVYQTWSAISSNAGGFIKEYSSYLLSTSGLLLGKVANKSVDLLLFMISVLFAGYLMPKGPQFMRSARKFADRVALGRGANLINLMKETIQNVSRGVIGIAILQTMLFGMVLLFAHVPAAGPLSFIALLLCIIQAGLFLVVLPVMVWLFYAKSFYFAIAMSILLFIVLILDSVLKPLVLARGLSTPMILIFLGLIGGLIVYGLIGVFIGPIVLAIFYDMLRHWLDDK
jgi:predicted PurR-regulated permease PerM